MTDFGMARRVCDDDVYARKSGVSIKNIVSNCDRWERFQCFSLRSMPTFVTARTFYASGGTRVSFGWCLITQDIFARSKTMQRKPNLASALGIQKEIGGNHSFFRDNKASI